MDEIRIRILRRYKKFGLLLLIMTLLLIFSIYLSLAIVNGLSSLKVKGNDGISGYVRSNIDKFNFNVIAKNNGLQINIGHVRLLGSSNNSGFAFDSCVPSLDGSYECQLTRNMSGFVICPKVSLDVNLYDQNGNFIDDEQVTLICDTAKPTITASVDKQKYGVKDNVTISYSISDTAYSGSFGNECSGIKNELKVSSGSFNKVYKINPGNACSYSGSIVESATVFNTGNISGEVSVNITAFDNFDQAASAFVYFDTDFQGLTFILKYFNVTDQNHDEIKYFRSMDVLLDFGVDILEKDFDESTIEADLSELGVSNAQASCFEIEDRKRCEWKNIRLFLQEPSISKIVTVSGKDIIGNKKTSVIALNKALSVDNKAPRFGNLQVKKQNGEKFNYTSADGQKITVSLDMLEPETGLEVNTVKADLSAFNPSVPGYKNILRDSCSAISHNLTRCTWNINVNLGQSGFVHNVLKFTAGDKSGNNASENIVYTVFIDDEEPVPVLFNVEGQQPDTLNYVSPKGSTLVLVVQEMGIGLDAKDVFLDAQQLTGNARLAADNCSQQGDVYTCYWYNVKSQQVSGRSFVSTSPDIKDKADNQIKGVLSLELAIDNKEPFIEKVEQTPKYPTYLDKIIFDVKVKDDLSGIKTAKFYPGSIVNATELGMECKAVEGSNETERRDVKCFVQLTGLEKKAKSDKVKIIVEDFAGNKAEKVLLLEVAQPEPGAIPDFFSVRSISISPTRVPRKATSQVAFSMFGRVSLSTRESNVQVISMSADCSNNTYVERDSTYIINEGSLEPIIAFRLTSAVGNIVDNEITVNCKLNMVIKRSDRIYAKPETENIELKIPLYDSPTGVADANVQAKLNEIDKEITDLQKEIASKEKFANILATWCTISELMGTLNSIMQNVKLLIYTITSFQEVNAIAAIDGAITGGTACIAEAEVVATEVCGASFGVAPACEEIPVYQASLVVTAGLIKSYKPLAAKGDAAAIGPADSIAAELLATSALPTATTLECPTFPPIITKGTAVWLKAKTSFIKICTWGGFFHSLVDNFIWPPGPFGIGGLASLPFGIIGMINKMGCAISYQCALCDWNDWMSLTVAAGQGAYDKLVKGVGGELPTGIDLPGGGSPGGVTPLPPSQVAEVNDEYWDNIMMDIENAEPLGFTKFSSGTEEVYKDEIIVNTDEGPKKVRLVATHSSGSIYQLGDGSQIVVLDDDPNVAYKTNLRVAQLPSQVGTFPSVAGQRLLVVSSHEGNLIFEGEGGRFVGVKQPDGTYLSADGTILKEDGTIVRLGEGRGEPHESGRPQKPEVTGATPPEEKSQLVQKALKEAEQRRYELDFDRWNDCMAKGGKGCGSPPSPPVTTKAIYEVSLTGQAAGPPEVPKPETYQPPKIDYKPDSNGWWSKIVETEAPKELQKVTWIWNPYKSKPYAYACMCYPPIIYNLKKERQIKCMYRNCLQHELTSGITTSACDLAYKERQCLYVDGAQFKLFDNENAMDNLVNSIATKLPFLIAGLIYKSICGTYSFSGDAEKCTAAFGVFIATAGKHPVLCGIAGTVQTLLELKSVFDTLYGGFSYPGQELKGPDYCATAGYPSERRDY